MDVAAEAHVVFAGEIGDAACKHIYVHLILDVVDIELDLIDLASVLPVQLCFREDCFLRIDTGVLERRLLGLFHRQTLSCRHRGHAQHHDHCYQDHCYYLFHLFVPSCFVCWLSVHRLHLFLRMFRRGWQW